jgi:hypothetical protein
MTRAGGGFGLIIAALFLFALTGAVIGVGLWIKPLESASASGVSDGRSDRPVRRERAAELPKPTVPSERPKPSEESAGAVERASPATEPREEAPPSSRAEPVPPSATEPRPADADAPTSIPAGESPALVDETPRSPVSAPASAASPAATRELAADERRARVDALVALGDRLRTLRGSWRLPMAAERREWIVKSSELAEIVGLAFELHADGVVEYATRVAGAPLQPPTTGGGFVMKLLPELAATSTVPGTERRLDPEMLAPWRQVVQLLGAIGAELESVADAHARAVAAGRDALNSAMRNNILKNARNQAREVLYSTDVALPPPLGELALRTLLQDSRLERELDAVEKAIAVEEGK